MQDALWKRLRQVKEIRFQQRINDEQVKSLVPTKATIGLNFPPAQAFSPFDDPPEKLAPNGPAQIRLVASEGMRMMTLNIHKQVTLNIHKQVHLQIMIYVQ